jgi:GMP synthase (glutamine-hydrolysing)
MAAVCVLQHVACESPGLIAEVLRGRGFRLQCVRPYKAERVPRSLEAHAGLVVMGGPMGLHEQEEYPFLRQEMRLIEQALEDRKPILGICLGSQLLAAVLGSVVTRGVQTEIGWHPVTLTQPAGQDRLWRGLQPSFIAYHWHGDVFELPRGAVSLAWSQLTDCQAFRFGPSAYGFLFHVEVTQPVIGRMTRAFRRELQAARVEVREILAGAARHLPQLHEIGRTVFQRWADLLLGENRAGSAPAAAMEDRHDAKRTRPSPRILGPPFRSACARR